MRVFLARHCEAEPGHRIPDHERALTALGRRQARALGSWLASRPEAPRVLRCSSAKRTLETAEQILRALPTPGEMSGEEELYLASARDLLTILRTSASGGRALIFVGHNPGIAELAVVLAQAGEPDAMRRLRSRFPPGACVELQLAELSGGGVATREGVLVDFWTPGAA